jgi:hypothetical protein
LTGITERAFSQRLSIVDLLSNCSSCILLFYGVLIDQEGNCGFIFIWPISFLKGKRKGSALFNFAIAQPF